VLEIGDQRAHGDGKDGGQDAASEEDSVPAEGEEAISSQQYSGKFPVVSFGEPQLTILAFSAAPLFRAIGANFTENLWTVNGVFWYISDEPVIQ
jgi:hypothetical protein